MDTITGSSPILLEGKEVRDKLALKGGNDRLLAKLDDLLAKAAGAGLHGGEVLKLQHLIGQARSLK
ncbi:hypothetical protein JFU47_32100 [Pseudomonas sp. TH39(2020)]|uniref:hypothetical protein n=1 Tax=Pseudomonas sp. TH39(2020) TaxID=2796349 RepID=UPI0019122F98|nr:hypothetical protein [Pseudomonas sp. TH39(2020)]MBK5401320.1 hypothetical protein [Pseudomonas sp. TH39(2020)]